MLDLEVIYIVERFPTFSETFIHDEIASHLANGIEAQVVVLTGANESDYPVSNCGDAIQRRITYLDVSKSKVALIMSGVATALRAGQTMKLFEAVRKSGLSLRELMIGSIIAARYPQEAILHCHFGNIGRIGLAAQHLSLSRKSLFVTFHAHEMTRRWFLPLEQYYASLFRSDATLLPISDYWRHILLEAGADPQRIDTHHMGVKLVDKPKSALNNDSLIKLVVVGRMVDKKGHVDAIEAIARLRDREVIVTCDFVGGGPCAEDLTKLIKAYGLKDQIRLQGSQPHAETLRFVESADIFLLPSVTASDGDMEGIPVSLMEAMARKIPVISTYHSGIPELIEDGVTGLLVPEREPEQLADAILKLARDPVLRMSLAEAGRARVEKNFNIAHQTEQLRWRYQKVVVPTS